MKNSTPRIDRKLLARSGLGDLHGDLVVRQSVDEINQFIKLRIQGILRLLVKRLGEDDGLGGVVEGVVLSHSGVLPFCSCLFCFCVSGVPFLTL